ncbi:MAG: molybdopterin molybdotransferase MoeA, partial [Alphaproteobacteria bacterium]|nr:molybdopterin molybdotransferase MoeA [Alphaproteobacteria bacterium]
MTPLDEAQRALLALARPVAYETVVLENAVGRWIGNDLIAQRDQPAADMAAMDGYALSIAAPPPWQVVGESAAGGAFSTVLHQGEAARIFTGALLPVGADTVIMQENIMRTGDMISPAPEHTLRKGANIRQMGSDFARGRNLITRGTRLTAAHIALAAMAGHASLPVARPIRIALVSTGDELVPPGAATRPDQIPSTNAPMLKAMLYGWPVIITTHHVPDDQAQLTALLTTLSSMDIIVTLGGASVGDHDIVRPAITAAGGQIDLWKVAMRPGKPLIIGQFSDAILLGLPGNPVSAYVTARLFFLPFIAALSGDLDPKV